MDKGQPVQKTIEIFKMERDIARQQLTDLQQKYDELKTHNEKAIIDREGTAEMFRDLSAEYNELRIYYNSLKSDYKSLTDKLDSLKEWQDHVCTLVGELKDFHPDNDHIAEILARLKKQAIKGE